MVAHNTHYTLVKQVENLLPALGTLDETTDPKKSQIEMLIHQAEDMVDRDTMSAWRYKRISRNFDFEPEEFTSIRPHKSSLWFDGVEIRLPYRNIAQLSASAGDKLTVRIGNTRTDYLALTEGLNGDYYLISEDGLLYVKRRWVMQVKNKVQVTYRYGDHRETDIDGTHNDSIATITVDSTDGFAYSGLLYIATSSGTEMVYYNGLTATTFTNCSRGQEGSTALSFAADDTVWQVPGDISKATLLRVAITIVQNDRLLVNESLGQGMDYEGATDRINDWKEEYESIIKKRLEVVRV